MGVIWGEINEDMAVEKQLYWDFRNSIEIAEEEVGDFRARFCGSPTRVQDARVYLQSMEFRPLGDDERPDFQQVDYFDRTLGKPKRYGLGSGVAASYWEGPRDLRLLQNATQMPITAYRKHITRVVIDAIFKTGQWYAADMTPPATEANTFTGSHDHYLGFAVSGVPSVTIAAQAKRHITHHTHDGSRIVGLFNGDAAEELEKSADIADSAIMYTPLIQELQRYGFRSEFPLAGVPHMSVDWIPSGYIAYICFEEETPMLWRADDANQDGLLAYVSETQPNAGTYWFGEFVTYSPTGGPTVIRRGAGVVVDLNNASYSAPTALVPTAA